MEERGGEMEWPPKCLHRELALCYMYNLSECGREACVILMCIQPLVFHPTIVDCQ
uniref:Uncharacterized protein n=1 Tax=Daphnia magna TaxID=35525 RepID=A0A0N8CNX9_9CRUS